MYLPYVHAAWSIEEKLQKNDYIFKDKTHLRVFEYVELKNIKHVSLDEWLTIKTKLHYIELTSLNHHILILKLFIFPFKNGWIATMDGQQPTTNKIYTIAIDASFSMYLVATCM